MRALAGLLALLIAGEALGQAQGTPQDRPVPSMAPSPPAMQRFQIRQDTPAERDAFLKRRQELDRGPKPETVPPLAAQRIDPLASQRQR